jgi:hypothetical protein
LNNEQRKMIVDTTIIYYQMRSFQGARYAIYSFDTDIVKLADKNRFYRTWSNLGPICFYL